MELQEPFLGLFCVASSEEESLSQRQEALSACEESVSSCEGVLQRAEAELDSCTQRLKATYSELIGFSLA